MKNINTIIAVVFISFFVGVSMVSAATLSVSPSSKTVNVGETFAVNIVLNTLGAAVDGVDVLYLNYNPAVLEVVDSDSSTAGVQINPSSTIELTVFNEADNAAGEIALSQISLGNTFSGIATVATITFRAKSAGLSPLTFDFAPGSTVDSNIASNGVDILSSATGGTFTVSAVSAPASGGGSSSGDGSSTGSGVSSSGGGGSVTVGSVPVSSSGGVSSSGSIGGGVSVTSSTGAPAVSFNRQIIPFTTDSEVLTLQRTLNALGFTVSPVGPGSPGQETSYYGPATTLAIQRFQCSALSICSGSPDTNGYGNFGPATRAALSARTGGTIPSQVPAQATIPVQTLPVVQVPVGMTPLTRTIYQGAIGEDVRTLQRLLNANGYTIALSGPGSAGQETTFFGPATTAAVQRMQCARLQICFGDVFSTGYGLVGARTRAALGN